MNEFLLVREAGFRPLGLVLGSSVYHVGIQLGRWSKNQELTKLSQAMYHARELAMSRMEAEASALGADGIVGCGWTSSSRSSARTSPSSSRSVRR
ncbi:heavy metal-binding domain-containing protein [Kitasatospora aburaviensis]